MPASIVVVFTTAIVIIATAASLNQSRRSGPMGLLDFGPPPCDLACLDPREKTHGILLPPLCEDRVCDDNPSGRRHQTPPPYPLPPRRLAAITVPRRRRRQRGDDNDTLPLPYHCEHRTPQPPTAIPASPSRTRTLLPRAMPRWKSRNLTRAPRSACQSIGGGWTPQTSMMRCATSRWHSGTAPSRAVRLPHSTVGTGVIQGPRG
jgi:hypothetical protein